MKIISGIFNNMVMQRNECDCSNQEIIGIAMPNCEVYAVLENGAKQLLGVSNEAGEFCGYLQNLKVGGPYKVTLSDGSEDLVFSNLLVGDVWMLAGQSNMQGYGNMYGASTPAERVRAFYLDDRWDIAEDPIHNMDKAKAEIHWTLNGGRNGDKQKVPIKGVGPGVAFAKAMEQKSGIPQGLIASAHGGTSLCQWSADLKDKGDDSLYGAMYNRFKANGSKIAGVLWYQGCNSAYDDEKAKEYTTKTIALFEAMRKDFNDENLPIVLVQLSRVSSDYDHILNNRWSSVRDQQRLIPESLSNCACVVSLDLERDDVIHLSGKAHETLGVRLADAMAYLQGDQREYPPLKIEKIEYEEDKVYGEYRTIIHVANVVGELYCKGNLPGSFTLHGIGATNPLAVSPFRCKLEGNKIIISSNSPLGCKVAYGFGCDPLVNIYDSLNRPLPGFGPIYSHKMYRTTPLLKEVEISEPIIGKDDFESLLPDKKQLEQLQFKKFTTNEFYFPVERIFGKGKYYHFIKWRCKCNQKINARIYIGSDAAFRVICDDKEIISSEYAINPIYLDEFSGDFVLDAGEHEFIMGLSGNGGNGWGFCCRIVNTDDILTVENESEEKDNLPIFFL